VVEIYETFFLKRKVCMDGFYLSRWYLVDTFQLERRFLMFVADRTRATLLPITIEFIV
jgi:hypothetical protein